jgi:hypothetical protein
MQELITPKYAQTNNKRRQQAINLQPQNVPRGTLLGILPNRSMFHVEHS